MKRILGVAWFALRATYDELFPLAGMGLLWFALTLLVPYGVFWLTTQFVPLPAVGIALLLVSLIPAPPATAAVYYVASYVANEKRIEFSYFWEGFKRYFGLSWLIAGIMIVAGLILYVDIRFYLNAENTIFAIIGFLGIWALVFWVAIQLYLYPLMIYQEKPKVGLMFKNASLLTLAYPFFSLGVLIVFALATALSVLLLLILFVTLWMPFVAILNSRALVSSLEQVEAFRQAQEELDEEAG